MKLSRLLSSFMVLALLFVVFHDFAVNTAEATQYSDLSSTQQNDVKYNAYTTAMEHQSFHQPFLIASDHSSLYAPLHEKSLHYDETDHSHYRSFDIFSPPKA